MNREFYYNEREIDLAEQKSIYQAAKKIVLARTLTFMAALISFAAGHDGYSYGYIGSIILLMIFVRLVYAHDENRNRQEFLKSRLAVVNSYITRAKGTWRKRSNDGSIYLKNERPQDVDLHIFGPGSIFQYICAARTKLGRDRLAQALSPDPPDFSAAKSRQRGVKEILQRPRLSLDLEAYARLMPNNHDTAALIESVETELPPTSKIYLLRFLSLPLFLISCLAAWKGLIDWYAVGIVPFFSFAVALAMLSRTSEYLKPLQIISKELRLYYLIFLRLETTDFSSKKLKAIRNALTEDYSAAQSLKVLGLFLDFVNARKNPVVFLIGNAFFLVDFFCVALFKNMRKILAEHLRKWLDAWAEAEVLMSLASIGQTRNTYCFPKLLTDKNPVIEVKRLKSILIADDKAVENDINLKAGTVIITGANMSGKTTWLRTLAGSVILAYAGAPVCAESFSVSPMHIFTSIRVNDDIGQGLSTFYAELLRIKSMIEFSEKKLPMLVCVDEIFRGTNSEERIIGAREAILRLTEDFIITLITTHDFELCDMAEKFPDKISNAHFDMQYVGDEIKFDFKLKEGRCRTTNAKYLLRMAGILRDYSPDWKKKIREDADHAK